MKSECQYGMWQVSSLRKSTREEVRELTKTLQATLGEMQGLVDAKTGELAESAHRNVQLGARVRLGLGV